MNDLALLLLGAAIGWLAKRSETRRTESREAGDLLAEIPSYVWKQGGDDSYLNLQVFLGRLRIRLRAAGVPDTVVRRLLAAATVHWDTVELTDDAETTRAPTEVVANLDRQVEEAQLWLFNPWDVRRRWRVRRWTLKDELRTDSTEGRGR